MGYIVQIEHEWNKKIRGYLGHSDALGLIFAKEKSFACIFSTLADVKVGVERRDAENRINIEDGHFIIKGIVEIEIYERKMINVEEL